MASLLPRPMFFFIPTFIRTQNKVHGCSNSLDTINLSIQTPKTQFFLGFTPKTQIHPLAVLFAAVEHFYMAAKLQGEAWVRGYS